MKAVWKYLVLKPVVEEVKTASGIYLDTKNETPIYKVESSVCENIPEWSLVIIDTGKVSVTVRWEDFVIVHEEWVLALI